MGEIATKEMTRSFQPRCSRHFETPRARWVASEVTSNQSWPASTGEPGNRVEILDLVPRRDRDAFRTQPLDLSAAAALAVSKVPPTAADGGRRDRINGRLGGPLRLRRRHHAPSARSPLFGHL